MGADVGDQHEEVEEAVFIPGDLVHGGDDASEAVSPQGDSAGVRTLGGGAARGI